jgi:hypothetical protein
MSTDQIYAAAIKAIDDFLFKTDGTGQSRFGRELELHVNKVVTNLVFKFGIAILTIAFVGGGAWYALSSKNDEQDRRISTVESDIKADIKEIKTDISSIESLLIDEIRKK